MKLWHKRIRDNPEGVTVDGDAFSVGLNGEMTVPDHIGRRLLRSFPDEFTTTAPAKKQRATQEAEQAWLRSASRLSR